jgi:hypothetical protein
VTKTTSTPESIYQFQLLCAMREFIVQFKSEGGWLLVSATRPDASRLVSFS